MYPFFYIKNIHEIKINDSIDTKVFTFSESGKENNAPLSEKVGRNTRLQSS